jgi:hypothetical protein
MLELSVILEVLCGCSCITWVREDLGEVVLAEENSTKFLVLLEDVGIGFLEIP